MRLLSALLVPCLAFAPLLQEPVPGPAATVTDASGTAVAITELRLLAEESEAGTLYVTRLPYIPLQTGRGEWRIPLAAIARVDVAPPATPAALNAPAHWSAQLRVTVPGEGRAAVTTATSSGHLPLDAALGMAAAELEFTRPTGEGPAAKRPVELSATVQIRELGRPAGRALPVLTLRLHNGESATGRPTGPFRLEGTRGAGTFRIDLTDCRVIELRQ